MATFDYRAPHTLEEATTILSDGAHRARPLAGGTDLLVRIRRDPAPPDVLVDLKRIPDLVSIAFDAGAGLTFGAAVPCSELAAHDEIRARYGALADAAGLVGGTAIRNRATVGGNLCNAAPSADTVPPLIVLDAQCLVEGPQGRRSVPVAEFVTGPGTSTLATGEILVAVTIPTPAAGSGSSYVRFIPRGEMDIAVAGAAAAVSLSGDGRRIERARVALAAVAPTPLLVPEAGRSLEGAEPTAERLAEAARICGEAARPIDDLRGTAAYRRHLAVVLARRALDEAIRRARDEEVSHG